MPAQGNNTKRNCFCYNIFRNIIRNKKKTIYTLLVLLSVAYYFALPRQLFKDRYSTVLESRNGKLLGARIAPDMQWRFPEIDSVPYKFKRCILAYEDEYFYRHPGFNPVSMVKAMITNIRHGKIVRGGSTITQQLIRLMRKNKRRTYFEKGIELILATRLEWRYSKDKILALYASHAPFGGNTVGLDAASWRYFGQNPSQLSWAESAMLAVLPNAPGMIHTNKNRQLLKKKRNRLLQKLLKRKIIDSTTCALAMTEPLPEKTHPLPDIAPHLLDFLLPEYRGKRIRTHIDMNLQLTVNDIVAKHYRQLKQNHIYNAAVVVMEVPTRRIIAYTGNTPTDKDHQKNVNIIDKARSTGSILKPFLYTAMLNAGDIMPRSLISDIPTDISGYQPENYDLQYRGMVHADIALRQSLNIPAVRMLRKYGMQSFYFDLKKLRLEHITKGAEYYGLSMILGGAEASLINLVRAYAGMSSLLNHYARTQGKYYEREILNPAYTVQDTVDFGREKNTYSLFNAGAVYTTMDVLRNVNRPEGNENWEFFNRAKNIAWKTGTSFGFRDAWAIGTTPEYVVGVWVGNADGEGRPGLTGHSAAAPILFDVYDALPQTTWFEMPFDEMTKIPVCRESGYKSGLYCPHVDTVYVPASCERTPLCPYHILIDTDLSGRYRVNPDCATGGQWRKTAFFILPPVQAFYYKKLHPEYRNLPPYKKNCFPEGETLMSFVGKQGPEKIYLPKDFDEKKNPLILKVKHQIPDAFLYWHVDGVYYTQTQYIHEVALHLDKGTHHILVTDDAGTEIRKTLHILSE